ncbi:TonB-dependent receptor plug domain-containing protein [Flavobacterium sp.]|uniref:TonB-dependent receptor plug domain-containing protein n=1 Tax=Flavobacterium sp. TaxID=239 RepID=UPI0039E47C39
MTRGKYIICLLILVCQSIWAQRDSIAIREVTVSDSQLRQFSQSQSVLKLGDSIVEKNEPSLTSLLNFNSPIYFKENGLGMVSSPSFRGTTAQQTAVIWNGININSQLNGQTDFNTVSTRDFENISVRSGGGSAIYGSSAIGGSIHLNNDLVFGSTFRNEFELGYGSFETYHAHYRVLASNEKVSVNAGISRNSSQNDYDYIDSKKDLKNENGQFYNTSMNVAFGYKINTNNYLKLYSQVFESERHFSLINPSDTKTKYRDFNTRNLLECSSFFNRFTSKVKVAFLSEKYQYFENIQSDDFYFGKVETFIAKYDLAYDINPDIRTNLIVDFTQNKADGSDIHPEKRQIGSAALLWKHRFEKVFVYELSVRKETTSNYDSPLLFSIGTNLSPSEHYSLKMNFSKNFRIPTFNDLYWKQGGNPDLKPESSRQIEIGNEFKTKYFRLTASVYQVHIQDMIRWIPGSGGVFSPENTNQVLINGAELALQYDRRLGNHHFNANGTYGYTDSRNRETDKQLIYVPFHKATAVLSYGFRKLSFAYQHLYNGFVYTQSDNNPKKKVGDYHVSNAMVFYDFGKKNTIQAGFKVLNLWNQKYESVDDRPLPGRHFNATLTFKF